MDYASDIDSYGMPTRKRKRGGASFMVIALGTGMLAAAWITAASDPYTELAHRVVEVKTEPTAEVDDRLPLFELAIDEAELAARGDTEVPESSTFDRIVYGPVWLDPVALLPGEDAARQIHADLIGPRMPDGMFFERAFDEDARRAVQRRLAMAGYAKVTPDGVFGPVTRDALVAFQTESELEQNGYADAATMAALEEKTAEKYDAWVERETRAARRAQARRSASRRTETAPVPQTREVPAAPSGGCQRRADGTIVGHQSVGCDIRGFGVALGRLFRGENPAGSGNAADFASSKPDR